MSDCPGRDLQTNLSSVAEVLEFWLCSGREDRGGGVPAPRDGVQGQVGAGEQPAPQKQQHHPSSSPLREQSDAKPGRSGLQRAGGCWGTPGRGGAGGLRQCHAMCRAVCRQRRRGETRAARPGLAGRQRAALRRCTGAVGLPARCSAREAKHRSRLGSVGTREVVWGKGTLALRGGRRRNGIVAAANSFWLQPGVAGQGGSASRPINNLPGLFPGGASPHRP